MIAISLLQVYNQSNSLHYSARCRKFLLEARQGVWNSEARQLETSTGMFGSISL